jgi:hypothetical protein
MGIFDAFSRSHKEERQRVKEAKREVNDLEHQRDKELKGVQKVLNAAIKNYDSRIQQAEKVISDLQNPGKGKKIVTVGKVTLYEHLVEVRGQKIQLSGLSVRVESTATASYLYFTTSGGGTLMESFSTEWRDTGITEKGNEVWVNRERSFTDEQIRHMQNAIAAAVQIEEDFLLRLPQMLQQAQTELMRCREDTTERDAAKANFDALSAESATVRSLQLAQGKLAEAERVLQTAINNASK